MQKVHLNLLLADDDIDDCTFFGEVLDELPVSTTLSIVNDGVELMDYLKALSNPLPDILFLDLNMPRKSGFECLTEIKENTNLSAIPVIVFSTSLNKEVVDLVYQKGAHYYIRKPGGYEKFKNVIFEALTLAPQINSTKPPRDKFILEPK